MEGCEKTIVIIIAIVALTSLLIVSTLKHFEAQMVKQGYQQEVAPTMYKTYWVKKGGK